MAVEGRNHLLATEIRLAFAANPETVIKNEHTQQMRKGLLARIYAA